jgi:hypothetical protein
MRIRGPKGAVLLLVLGAVAILSVLAIEIARRASLDSCRSARQVREAAFQRCFDSAMEVARGMLIEHRKSTAYDYWGDGWGKQVTATLDPGSQFTVRVADENGKFNLLQVMEKGAASGNAKKSLARIFEWMCMNDAENESRLQEAQSAILQRLGANLKEKEQPRSLFTLDGLREAGVPHDLLFGTKDSHKPALCDFLTVFGNRTLNLNTASPAVLYGLDPEYDQTLVDGICGFRGGAEMEEAAKFTPFKTVGELAEVDGIIQRVNVNGRAVVVKDLLAKVQSRLSVSSTCFSARIHAEVDGHVREAWAFFECSAPLAGGNQSLRLLAYEEIEP